MSKRLVILTDNFGLNFSGGATATCRIIEQLVDNFSELIVVGKQEGDHPFSDLLFLTYSYPWQAIRHLRRLGSKQTIFYGDFYMAYYFILAGVPYFFTYHDNWPEQAKFDWKNRLRGLFYIPLYRWIIRRANSVATVSAYKYEFVKRLNPNSSLIRNGVNAPQTKKAPCLIKPEQKLRLLMLGNVDDRKFGLAVDLFNTISRHHTIPFCQIDVYGHIKDKSLANRLKSFSFVKLHGFTDRVDFSNYHLYLCTSKMENLSIAVCEALINYTPVLSFDVGGHGEVIQHLKTGILIAPGNIDQFYDYLQKIYFGAISFDFRDQDLSVYDWEKAARSYIRFFGLETTI